MKKHPHLDEILKQYDLQMGRDLWDCKGTLVAYHHALERVAQQAKIRFEPPQVLTDDYKGRGVAICVIGALGDQAEWSIGEASESNYRVVGKMQGYPWAMAEKRAKDRVILKLIGLHGAVYSEEESDDFKPSSANTALPSQNHQPPQGDCLAMEHACNEVKDIASGLKLNSNTGFVMAMQHLKNTRDSEGCNRDKMRNAYMKNESVIKSLGRPAFDAYRQYSTHLVEDLPKELVAAE